MIPTLDRNRAMLEQLENFLNSKTNISHHSLQIYKSDLKKFCKYLESIKVDLFKLDTYEIKAYLEILKCRYKDTSFLRKKKTVSLFFDYLEKNGFIECNPIKKIDFFEKNSLSKKNTKNTVEKAFIISREELDQILHYVSKKENKRDKLIFQILVETGIRAYEIINLTKHNIHPCTKQLYISCRYARSIPISDTCISFYKAYIETRDDNYPSLFITDYQTPLHMSSLYNILDTYGQLANLKYRLTPKYFRHYFAHQLLKKKYDLKEIKKLLGNSSLTTLKKYLID